MSFNSSSSNASLHDCPSSRYCTIHTILQTCMFTTQGASNITAFAITVILLLLPLCVFVLRLGIQRWRQRRPGTTMSHSDFFTYNMTATELMNVLGSFLSCCGVYTNLKAVVMLGIYLFSLNLTAQMVFHILTCVERYLAVVHPVTYLGLRRANRIRNVAVGCVWLLCFAEMTFKAVADYMSIAICTLCFVTSAVIVISFCSVSVLFVLIRPGPGEGGGDRQRVNQSKLRAFYTIVAILGVLMVRFGGNILTTVLPKSSQVGMLERCGLWLSELWLSLPSSLVLPLLFLQRAGKLPCHKKTNESG